MKDKQQKFCSLLSYSLLAQRKETKERALLVREFSILNKGTHESLISRGVFAFSFRRKTKIA
ncbi:hypothetical protein EZY14_019450 [Kordia sp. TARA_039_SRF]|nr:hypothetical protein EZY14_019450 [Kordia sp. TARA_039_SRF]